MSNLRTEESQDGLNQNDKILGVNEDGCLINIDADVFAGKVPIKMEDSECADGVSLFKESKTETCEFLKCEDGIPLYTKKQINSYKFARIKER